MIALGIWSLCSASNNPALRQPYKPPSAIGVRGIFLAKKDNCFPKSQRPSPAEYFVVEQQVAGLLGQIEHSIRQTVAAPFRLLLKPRSLVEVAQCIGEMIESIQMF